MRIEEYPKDVRDKINYKRFCDVECLKCGSVKYSKPYDRVNTLNPVRKFNGTNK